MLCVLSASEVNFFFFVFLSKLEIHALSLTAISKETEISLFSRWRYRMKITVHLQFSDRFSTRSVQGFFLVAFTHASPNYVAISSCKGQMEDILPIAWNSFSKFLEFFYQKKKRKENVLYFRRTCWGFENERLMRLSWVETIMVSGQSWELTSFKCSIKLITYSLPFFFQRRLSFSTDAFKQ